MNQKKDSDDFLKSSCTKSKLKTDRRGKDFFLESHGKQHGGRKDKLTNPMTGQRHA